MWNFLRKRHTEDLKRLGTAYRCYLKASDQAEFDGYGDENRRERNWKGGFAKALNQLFRQWPTPNQSWDFEKKMVRWLKKNDVMDHAFIYAFNEYLHQKRLNPSELNEVVEKGRDAHTVK